MLRILVLLVILTSPAGARSIHGASSGGLTPGAFNGNPNVTISAIGGGIATSLDNFSSSCQTPCFVQVSASGVTATGTSAPYEDLSYTWNFGEGCGPTFTRPTDGASVCSGNGQRQPEAAYRFDTAGTKVISLVVQGCSGSVGTPNTANQGICASLFGPVTITKTITVTTFSGGDQYADCGGAGSGQDGTLAHPWTTLAQINTALNAGNIALHVKPGCTWVSTSGGGIVIDAAANRSGIRVDKNYPASSGANPIFQVNTGADNWAMSIRNNFSVDDVVFSDIDFVSNATNLAVAGLGFQTSDPTKVITRVYFSDVNLTMACDCGSVIFAMSGANNTNSDTFLNYVGLWNVVTYSNPAYTTTDIGENGSAVNWHFRIGGSVTGSGTNTALSHHIYPDIKSHGLFQWITCGLTGASTGQRGYCVNNNWDGILNNPADHQLAQYHVFAENYCKNTIFCVDLGNRTNNSNPADSTVQFQYVVISSNALDGVGALNYQCGLSVTHRDNRMWNTAGVVGTLGFFIPPNTQQSGYTQGANLLSKSYRNKIYIAAASYDGGIAPSFQFQTDNTWTAKQFVTDNTTVDARTSVGALIGLPFTDLIASSSVVDRNVYSQVGGVTVAWYNVSTSRTFAQWQAAGTTPNRWDAAGVNLAGSTPSGWTLPVTQWSHMN